MSHIDHLQDLQVYDDECKARVRVLEEENARLRADVVRWRDLCLAGERVRDELLRSILMSPAKFDVTVIRDKVTLTDTGSTEPA